MPSPHFDAEALRVIDTREFFTRFIRAGVRPDARKLTKHRSSSITLGSITTAVGSALVTNGQSNVLAAIKAEVGHTNVMTPDQGQIQVSLQLPPLCSASFSIGKPSVVELALSHRLSQVISKCDTVPLSSLSIESGVWCWVLFIDVICLNFDGNVFDTALLAIIAALRSTRLPRPCPPPIASHGEALPPMPVVVSADEFNALQVTHSPVSASFVIIEGTIIADPSAEETRLADAEVTCVFNELGELCGIYKPGGCSVADDVLRQCITLGMKRARRLSTLLTGTLQAHRA